eukprot:252284-Prymnesium_polylepis.2
MGVREGHRSRRWALSRRMCVRCVVVRAVRHGACVQEGHKCRARVHLLVPVVKPDAEAPLVRGADDLALVEARVVLPRRDALQPLRDEHRLRHHVDDDVAHRHPLARLVVKRHHQPLGAGQHLRDDAVRELDARPARPHLRAEADALGQWLGRPLARLLLLRR